MRRNRGDRFEERFNTKAHIYRRVENAIFLPECSKVGYSSKKDALTIKNARLRGGSFRRPERLRAYPCPDCGMWHLTKQPDRNEEFE